MMKTFLLDAKIRNVKLRNFYLQPPRFLCCYRNVRTLYDLTVRYASKTVPAKIGEFLPRNLCPPVCLDFRALYGLKSIVRTVPSAVINVLNVASLFVPFELLYLHLKIRAKKNTLAAFFCFLRNSTLSLKNAKCVSSHGKFSF